MRHASARGEERQVGGSPCERLLSKLHGVRYNCCPVLSESTSQGSVARIGTVWVSGFGPCMRPCATSRCRRTFRTASSASHARHPVSTPSSPSSQRASLTRRLLGSQPRSCLGPSRADV